MTRMTEIKKIQNCVHVTLATLKKSGAFFSGDEGNGFIMSGWKVPMGTAVFCGKVLETKEIEMAHASALGICLDDGTGIHVFKDVIRYVPVKKGDYIKIFGAIRPNKQDKTMASVVVHVIRKIEKNPGSVMSCFMLEAIQAVAAVMGNKKASAIGLNGHEHAAAAVTNPNTTTAASAETNDIQLYGLDEQSNKVLGIVIKNKSEDGALFPGDFAMTGLNDKKLLEILNQLADDGHVYTTVDDSHYKSTG